jgi:hypothetical protein
MNQPHQFEPVPALQLAEGTVIHSSARTSITTNLSPAPREGAQVCIGSARLEMAVGAGGALHVRYAVQALARMPARPLGRRAAQVRR